MANIPCDICESETSAMMQTNLATGDTVAVGPACMATFALSSAVAFADGMPDDVKATHADMAAAVAEAYGATPPPSLPKRAKAKTSPRDESAQGVNNPVYDEDPVTGDMVRIDGSSGTPDHEG